jgi:hypothetical protein
MDEPVPAANSKATACPNCGAFLEIEPGTQPPLRCPNCQADFVSTIDEPFTDATVDWEEPEPEPPARDELDGLRIRKLVQARRSAIRARTYALVILICCIVMGVQLILTDVQEVHLYGWDFWAVLYAILTAVMVIIATIASRKSAELHRESNLSESTEPEHAPQFEALSDGSQHVENLEEMTKEE